MRHLKFNAKLALACFMFMLGAAFASADFPAPKRPVSPVTRALSPLPRTIPRWRSKFTRWALAWAILTAASYVTAATRRS